MALADRGWTDLGILGDSLLREGWNRYRSLLLLFALALHFLGAAVSPIQQLILSSQVIRRPTFPVPFTHITDSSGLPPSNGETDGEDGFDPVMLRAILTSTVDAAVQPRLWSLSIDLVSIDDIAGATGVYPSVETKSENTLIDMSSITDPFWAELPSGINTWFTGTVCSAR